MAGEPPPPAAGAAEPDSEAETSSLLALADSELSAGRLRAARKHARRAALLDPACPRAALILTAASVLLADESSHHAVLLLPSSSPLAPSALRRHFKSLAKSLRPRPEDGAASSPAVAAAAEEALGRAAAAYEALTEPAPDPDPVPVQGTFWTACAGCRLLHEFERTYLGYRLMCPSCRRTFLATEVPPPPEARAAAAPTPLPPAKKAKTENPEDMTLAEMQLLLTKKRGSKPRKAPNRSSSRAEEDAEEEEQNNHSDLMAVEDSDFYNFDADRGERCIKKGQVWALYGDDDGMPRHYAVVDGVMRGGQFRAQVRWLDGEEGKPCGQFKVGRLETLHSVNVFSHLVACERAARELYRVYPRKRSVWALREEGSEGRIKDEIVVFLSGYSELYGASFGYLKKVQGFRSIFTRRGVGSRAVYTLHKGDLGALSHQIPARKVSKGEGSTLPTGDCWELDPASLPSEFLRVGLRS
ncbi:hypothetical protein PR202_gb18154 [Eleusine coracana subsp. coracana]|uniref:DUF3444 domain-containing protein n=1 Tax=Eleusine coracana subsp. coracana TaxID=191504 RepID=A0AAV5F4X6_ELECO|nr:hypothetical protein QOZ80_6BG0458440 [Eleusine coracana subsp. coracana]GJN29892.1 hypothetical protein PR202_gb18154 [Eleusine coracana subsp. coracana]